MHLNELRVSAFAMFPSVRAVQFFCKGLASEAGELILIDSQGSFI